jgi:hypothetical protein
VDYDPIPRRRTSRTCASGTLSRLLAGAVSRLEAMACHAPLFRIGYARRAVRPRKGGAMFRYRLHSPDGDDLGEAMYAQMITQARRSRVVDVPVIVDNPVV